MFVCDFQPSTVTLDLSYSDDGDDDDNDNDDDDNDNDDDDNDDDENNNDGKDDRNEDNHGTPEFHYCLFIQLFSKHIFCWA